MFKENIAWIQNMEPISAGFNGSNAGVMNRPLKDLLANDKDLNTRLLLLERTILNKSDSFFITSSDNNIKFRVKSITPIIAYLPLVDTDFSITIIKIGGEITITPQSTDYIYEGQLSQSITNDDEFSVITLDYNSNIWYPTYKLGTWTF